MRTNHGVSFSRHIFKKYKYPSLRSRFAVAKTINPHLDVNFSLGITIRFMEPWEQSYFTYFSFPFAVGAKWDIIQADRSCSTGFFINAGYHIKHPRYKYRDGGGGFIGSGGLSLKNNKKNISCKLGYEMEHVRSFRPVYSPGAQRFDYIYHQYVNQEFLSIWPYKSGNTYISFTEGRWYAA